MKSTVRIDKFLYCVRLFKTRSQATNACEGGKVKVNNNNIKPSKNISVGDIITISYPGYKRVLQVLSLLDQRVGAKLVSHYIQDITPEEELIKRETIKSQRTEYRPKGLGRPTKKERRMIDKFKQKK